MSNPLLARAYHVCWRLLALRSEHGKRRVPVAGQCLLIIAAAETIRLFRPVSATFSVMMRNASVEERTLRDFALILRPRGGQPRTSPVARLDHLEID